MSITKLPIQTVVSATVISNLERFLEGYCAKLLAQGKLSSCTPPGEKILIKCTTRRFCSDHFYPSIGDDPPLPEIRSWTEWSNDHSAHWSVEYPAQQCPQGHYITDFSWLQYEHGFKDVKIKCSGMDWYKPPVGSKVHHDDFWTEVSLLIRTVIKVQGIIVHTVSLFSPKLVAIKDSAQSQGESMIMFGGA